MFQLPVAGRASADEPHARGKPDASWVGSRPLRGSTAPVQNRERLLAGMVAGALFGTT
jgi:hypothetical protein